MATNQMSILSTITGGFEGGTDLINLAINNTSAVYTISQGNLGTNGIAGGTTFTLPVGARQVLIVPPTTNTSPMRVANSTTDTGLAISSSDPTLISVTTVLSTVFIWSTSTAIAGNAVSNLRVIIL